MANIANQTETPKLKLQTQVTETVDLDINLPYFAKYGDSHFFKVTENKTVISAKIYKFSTAIEMASVDTYGPTLVKSDCVPCDECEFNQAYETALTKIQNQTL